jgi:GT2 family glycosyltransferase
LIRRRLATTASGSCETGNFMSISVNAVVAFIQETNQHTRFNISTLIDTVSELGGIHLVAIANGCVVSDELRNRCRASPAITLIETKQNIGVPAAWNIGLDACSASERHVLVLNDDVWFDRFCVNQLVAVLESFPDTAVVGLEGQVCRRTDKQGFPQQKKHFGKKKRAPSRIGIHAVSKADGFLFALSRHFLNHTRFRFDVRYTPAFCEELDLAFSARSLGYRVRIVSGLDDHYMHIYGVSASNRMIWYLNKAITTRDLTQRNTRLFTEKWAAEMNTLIRP